MELTDNPKISKLCIKKIVEIIYLLHSTKLDFNDKITRKKLIRDFSKELLIDVICDEFNNPPELIDKKLLVVDTKFLDKIIRFTVCPSTLITICDNCGQMNKISNYQHYNTEHPESVIDFITQKPKITIELIEN